MSKESPRYNTEKDLISSLQEGRQEALGFLYDKYAPVLLGLITKIFDDKDLAEEVFQESFIQIWNGIGGYDPNKSSLAFWMLSTTREVALDAYKSGRCKSPSVNGEPDELESGTAETITIREDRGKIQDSATLQDPGKKMVFDLIFWKGYSCSEAAEKLGIPVEMVKTTFRAAVKELRAGLKA